jgi:hypothetical protein
MNWKDIHTEATSSEREQILHLLLQRIAARAEKARGEHLSVRARLKLVIVYCRNKLNIRRRAHWIGSGRRRLERPAIILLFLGAMLLLEPREYATWAAIFGGFTAMLFPFLFFHYQLMCLLGEE